MWQVWHVWLSFDLDFAVQVKLWEGMYSVFMADWLRVFPRQQIHVIRYRDLVRDTNHVMNQIFKFLEVRKFIFFPCIELIQELFLFFFMYSLILFVYQTKGNKALKLVFYNCDWCKECSLNVFDEVHWPMKLSEMDPVFGNKIYSGEQFVLFWTLCGPIKRPLYIILTYELILAEVRFLNPTEVTFLALFYGSLKPWTLQ